MKKWLFFALVICGVTGAKAQFYSVRTNALGLVSGTANAAVEVAVGKQWSVEVGGYWNSIETERFSSQFWFVQPAVRHWFYEHFVGHFVAVHPALGRYKVGNNRWFYRGFFTGIGASYGYVWPVRKRLNLTAESGIGIYFMSDEKRSKNIDDWAPEVVKKYRRIIVAPSKLEISLSYLF